MGKGWRDGEGRERGVKEVREGEKEGGRAPSQIASAERRQHFLKLPNPKHYPRLVLSHCVYM
jgi:hypothetical protein